MFAYVVVSLVFDSRSRVILLPESQQQWARDDYDSTGGTDTRIRGYSEMRRTKQKINTKTLSTRFINIQSFLFYVIFKFIFLTIKFVTRLCLFVSDHFFSTRDRNVFNSFRAFFVRTELVGQYVRELRHGSLAFGACPLFLIPHAILFPKLHLMLRELFVRIPPLKISGNLPQ